MPTRALMRLFARSSWRWPTRRHSCDNDVAEDTGRERERESSVCVHSARSVALCTHIIVVRTYYGRHSFIVSSLIITRTRSLQYVVIAPPDVLSKMTSIHSGEVPEEKLGRSLVISFDIQPIIISPIVNWHFFQPFD